MHSGCGYKSCKDALELIFFQRLAGESDWKEPIKLATEIVREYGGPESYLSGDDNPSRRFILEQMACQEIICAPFLLLP